MTADSAPRAAVDVLGELIEDSAFTHGGRIGTLAASRVAEDIIAAGWSTIGLFPDGDRPCACGHSRRLHRSDGCTAEMDIPSGNAGCPCPTAPSDDEVARWADSAADLIAAGWAPPRPAMAEAPPDLLLDLLYGAGRKPGGAA